MLAQHSRSMMVGFFCTVLVVAAAVSGCTPKPTHAQMLETILNNHDIDKVVTVEFGASSKDSVDVYVVGQSVDGTRRSYVTSDTLEVKTYDSTGTMGTWVNVDLMDGFDVSMVDVDRLAAMAKSAAENPKCDANATSAMVHSTPGGQLTYFGACDNRPRVDDAWLGDTKLPTEINLEDPTFITTMDQLLQAILGTPDIIQLLIEPDTNSINITTNSLPLEAGHCEHPSIRASKDQILSAILTNVTCSDPSVYAESSTFRIADYDPRFINNLYEYFAQYDITPNQIPTIIFTANPDHTLTWHCGIITTNWNLSQGTIQPINK